MPYVAGQNSCSAWLWKTQVLLRYKEPLKKWNTILLICCVFSYVALCQLYNMLTFTSTVKSAYVHCCVLAESCLTCSFLVLPDDNEPLLISQLCVHEHLAPSVPLFEASAPSTLTSPVQHHRFKRRQRKTNGIQPQPPETPHPLFQGNTGDASSVSQWLPLVRGCVRHHWYTDVRVWSSYVVLG